MQRSPMTEKRILRSSKCVLPTNENTNLLRDSKLKQAVFLERILLLAEWGEKLQVGVQGAKQMSPVSLNSHEL